MDPRLKGTILIVDDTPANLRVLAQLLDTQGYETRLMPSGARALASVQKTIPDLILLDIMMPEMDGYEVCRALKSNTKTENVPVIFISALDELFDKVTAFASGGVDYITKPFQEAEVLARVETHLTMRFLQQELQQKNEALQDANDSLEARVTARTQELAEANESLTNEIEHRKQHQAEKDRLFELVQQQSEQLRSMTNWLLESKKDHQKGLTQGLDLELKQKITLIRSDLTALQRLLVGNEDSRLRSHLTNISDLLAEMQAYLNDVTAQMDEAETADKTMSDNPLLQLSVRERQVLQLMVEGKTNADIADIMIVRLSTIHTYIKRIRRKLGIQDVPGLVKFAQDHGLID
ncbi:MAG: response regulator [Chloroflexota bacterium]